MEAIAKKKFLRVSARKLGLLADLARGKKVQQAIDVLRFSNRKMADEVVRLIRSAVNNAGQNQSVNIDNLYVKTILVGQGPLMKRVMARARGSADQILKRMSHLTVIVDEKEESKTPAKGKKEVKVKAKKATKAIKE